MTVGAYERDNFGDLLFLLVTEKYLMGANIFPAAPFSADMAKLLDRKVHAYGPLLDQESFDVIWTVGGGVGSLSTEQAYLMSANDDDFEQFRCSLPDTRDKILRRAVGGAAVQTPYIPDPLQYPLNCGAITVVNSAGLAGSFSAAEHPDLREEYISLFRGTTLISVRNRESSKVLDALGIEHTMAPDVVHAIDRLWPAAEHDRQMNSVIFQCAGYILDELGIEQIAEAICSNKFLRDANIKLLMAGTARGHDSSQVYERLAAAIKKSSRSVNVEIIYDRGPLALVEYIRNARLVIGSSLHVRVVSCSYNVPRVSLRNWKIPPYVTCWDPDMPCDVTPETLAESVDAALDREHEPAIIENSARVSTLAHNNIERIASDVVRVASGDTYESRNRRFMERRENRFRFIR